MAKLPVTPRAKPPAARPWRDDGRPRCAWCIGADSSRTKPNMVHYHDTEWGVPVHDDRKHFEFLVLDAFQAGLSWAIVLDKREGFRSAFARFDPKKVACFGAEEVEALVQDASIVRNRQKIEATVRNAGHFLDLSAKHGSFDDYIWGFVDGSPRQPARRTSKSIPATSRESDAMSKELMRLGFRFVGSTICYAYMQAAGMVNDHVVTCFRHDGLRGG